MKSGLIMLTAVALLAGGAAHAQAQTMGQALAVEAIVQQDARDEAAVANAIAVGALRGPGVALAEEQLARRYAMQAAAFDRGATPRSLGHLAQDQRQGLQVPRWPALRHDGAATRQARQHEALSAVRSAQQQQAIARQWAAGALDVEQLARLEAGQAALAELRLAVHRMGADSVDLAMQMQHLQNIQDWAIATAQPVL